VAPIASLRAKPVIWTKAALTSTIVPSRSVTMTTSPPRSTDVMSIGGRPDGDLWRGCCTDTPSLERRRMQRCAC